MRLSRNQAGLILSVSSRSGGGLASLKARGLAPGVPTVREGFAQRTAGAPALGRSLVRERSVVAFFLVVLLTLSAFPAEASGRRVLNNFPAVPDGRGGINLPVVIANASIVYPVVKYLPPARVARALGNAFVYGSAATVLAQSFLDLHNAGSGDNISYNYVTNNFPNNTPMQQWTKATSTCGTGTAFIGSIEALKSMFESATEGTSCYTSGRYGDPVVWSGSCITSPALVTSTSSCSLNYTQTIRNSSGSFYSTSSGGWSKNAGASVGTAPPATDVELSGIVESYPDPYNQRDFWEPPASATEAQKQNIDNASHTPLALSSVQLDALRAQLSTSCDPAGDPLVYEICLMGQEHGVIAAPDPLTTDEATKTDEGAATGGATSVTVNVTPDTPGGTFAEPELAALDTFESLTQQFLDAVTAAPIVAAWTGISGSVPAAACPVGTVNIFGASYNVTEIPCEMWDNIVAPLLALVFLFVWPFLGLRIIMSA